MSAAEHLQEAIDVGCTRDDHDHVADHRAEVLAEVKTEVVAWLVKKAAERETWDAAVLASKVDRGAVRAFIGTGHYRDAMDEHRAAVLTEAGWVPCSPKWLANHPDECPTAPRVPGGDNTSHWHPDRTHTGAYRRIAEVLDYLATKDATKLSEDAGAMGFHIVAVLDGPGPIEDPATRPALPWAAFLEDVEVSALVEELASVFLDYWRGERAADASTLAEVERLLVKHRDGSQAAEAAGKDTSGTPAGKSTQPADDEVMRAVREAIETFQFDAYGLDDIDPNSQYAEWVGDLASAIAGALPDGGGAR